MADCQGWCDLIWFQHFHKAGGTSLIEAARASGWEPYHPHLNCNPVHDDESPLRIWDWDSGTLGAWLNEAHQNGVTFVACEWGFSHAVRDVTGLDITQIAIMRRPKERLVSNYLFDVTRGHTRAACILDYLEEPLPFHGAGPQPFRAPDYYTRRVTGHGGPDAQEGAFAALAGYDHIAFLEDPDSFRPLQGLIPGVGARHENRTDRDSAALRAAIDSVERHEAALTDMVAGDQALYDRLRDHFA